MSAERDLILALIRRLNADGVLDEAAISDIADELASAGGEDHAGLAHDTRLTLIPRALDGESEMWAQHRRRQIKLRTQMLADRAKGNGE